MRLEDWNRAVGMYPDLDLLKRAVYTGRLEHNLPRHLLWKVLLVYKTLDQSVWAGVDQTLRDRYRSLRGKLRDDTPKLELADPLSDRPSTSDDIKEVIQQDVDRTFPELEFFRQPAAQDQLANILRVYADLDPEIGYRQGMHELAGPVLFVMYERENDKHTEADAFAVFEAIMKQARGWYKPSHTNHPPEIVTKSQRIQRTIIRHADPSLYNILTYHEIEPQMWGIRYIRLMFGREMGGDFHRLLQLWDGIFSADDTLGIVDYISAVLLIRMRPQLLDKTMTHSDLLACLLRPSHVEDQSPPYHFVVNALYLERNLNAEGGKYVARQYNAALSDTPPQSPRFNIERVFDAAKTYSSKWDMDKIRETLDETRKKASSRFHSPSASVTSLPVETKRDAQREQALAESLSHSLKILDKKAPGMNDNEMDFAIEAIRHVTECLRNPERPAIVFSPEVKSSPPSQPQSRNRTPIAKQSEYSWLLGASNS